MAAVNLGNTHPVLRRGWHAVALSDEIGDAPVAVTLLAEGWVLVRLDGSVRAFADRCPHRFAPLSAGCVVDGELQCRYHGWRFGADGTGTAIPALGEGSPIPSKARLVGAAEVAERYGIVWLAPEPPVAPLPRVPQDGDPRFRRGILDAPTVRASAGLLLDNFLDAAHFPFVHAATFGTSPDEPVEDMAISRDGPVMTAISEHTFANREDPGVAAGLRPLLQRRRMTYTYVPPFVATLQLEYLDAGGTNVIVFAVQPQTAEQCRVFTTLLRDDVDGDAELAAAVAFEQEVLAEDLAIQAVMPLTLPLDVTAEVHTRADKLTLELRRILASLIA